MLIAALATIAAPALLPVEGALAAGAEASALLSGSAPRSLPAAVQATSGETPIEFDVSLQLRDPQGAQELARAVSEPGGPQYRHYLTAAQWERRFSPSQASVDSVTRWLRSDGITVEGVTADRMTVEANASAATVEQAFKTGLAEYRVDGRLLRLASGELSVPARLAGVVTSVEGVNERIMRPATLAAASGGAVSAPDTAPAGRPIEPPEVALSPPPCSSYWGEKLDTAAPSFGAGYPEPLPYATCGYEPAQLQSSYGLTQRYASGDDGSGVTVAITDAYASPTLAGDVREWGKRNGDPIKGSQFKEDISPTFNEERPCEAAGWGVEQSLDVEAVHSMAPGANILFVGAKNCGTALDASVESLIDEHAADIITNSWLSPLSQAVELPAEQAAFDKVLLLADGTGIGVQFASGDEGDGVLYTGEAAPSYPASSPYATGVGGTSVLINSAGEPSEELGWSNAISFICTPIVHEFEVGLEAGIKSPIGCTPKRFGTWAPKAPGNYWAGGGGGTSYQYAEPYYQVGVVPRALADRNRRLTDEANRVVPDISMDADPLTGLKMGETILLPGGRAYEEFPIGGTSLASPLLAGELAVADQAAGTSLGFINPLLYRLDASPATAANAFDDVLPPAHPLAAVVPSYVNGVNGDDGEFFSALTLGYEGKEIDCEPEGGFCVQQQSLLHAASGYDSMTGIGAPGPQFVRELLGP